MLEDEYFTKMNFQHGNPDALATNDSATVKFEGRVPNTPKKDVVERNEIVYLCFVFTDVCFVLFQKKTK